MMSEYSVVHNTYTLINELVREARLHRTRFSLKLMSGSVNRFAVSYSISTVSTAVRHDRLPCARLRPYMYSPLYRTERARGEKWPARHLYSFSALRRARWRPSERLPHAAPWADEFAVDNCSNRAQDIFAFSSNELVHRTRPPVVPRSGVRQKNDQTTNRLDCLRRCLHRMQMSPAITRIFRALGSRQNLRLRSCSANECPTAAGRPGSPLFPHRKTQPLVAKKSTYSLRVSLHSNDKNRTTKMLINEHRSSLCIHIHTHYMHVCVYA